MAAEVVDDLAECCQARHHREIDIGQIGHQILHGAQDLDPLDRVDPQVGLEFHLHTQHLSGVPGSVGDDPQQQRHHLDRRQTNRHLNRSLDHGLRSGDDGWGDDGWGSGDQGWSAIIGSRSGRGRRFYLGHDTSGARWNEGRHRRGDANDAMRSTVGRHASELTEHDHALLGGDEECAVSLCNRVEVRGVSGGRLLLSSLVGGEHSGIG